MRKTVNAPIALSRETHRSDRTGALGGENAVSGPVFECCSLCITGATGAGKQRRNGRPLPTVKQEKDTRIRVESHPNRGDIYRKDGTNQGVFSAATGAPTGRVTGHAMQALSS